LWAPGHGDNGRADAYKACDERQVEEKGRLPAMMGGWDRYKRAGI